MLGQPGKLAPWLVGQACGYEAIFHEPLPRGNFLLCPSISRTSAFQVMVELGQPLACPKALHPLEVGLLCTHLAPTL